MLLTAYADTDVAIAGINEVQLDHYLMKPWDPPAERLYPVLDDLLGDWSASFRPPFEGIRVAGSLWSPKSHEVKDFLSRNQTPYQWIDVEQDAAVRAEAEAASPGLAPAAGGVLPRRHDAARAERAGPWPRSSACRPRRRGRSTTW